MCKDPINLKLPNWKRSALLNQNHNSPTKVVPVLHKFTSLHNPILFTPGRPFKCENILIWYSKPIIIQQIKIGNMNQLTYPVYEQQLTAPNTLKVVEESFKNGILPRMLRENHVYHLDFMTADSEHSMIIEFEGSFDVMALYGTELHENPQTL